MRIHFLCLCLAIVHSVQGVRQECSAEWRLGAHRTVGEANVSKAGVTIIGPADIVADSDVVTFGETLQSPPLGENPNLADLEIGRRAVITKEETAVAIVQSAEGDGIWVPYNPGHLTYAFMPHDGSINGSIKWMGTGPFSGCWFAIILRTKTGQLGVAHIPQPPAQFSQHEWETFKSSGAFKVMGCYKFGLPDPERYSGSHAFLDFTANPYRIVKVDVATTNMGGGDGQGFRVSDTESESKRQRDLAASEQSHPRRSWNFFTRSTNSQDSGGFESMSPVQC